MTKPHLTLTRRAVTAFLATLPVSGTAVAQGHDSIEDRFRRELAHTALPREDMTLSLVRFDEDAIGGNVRLVAVVELSSRPGVRRRQITSASQTPELALNDLIKRTLQEFRLVTTA